MPLRMVILENDIFGAFPILGTGDFVVLVEVYRLVLIDDFVRLEIEVLLLEFLRSSTPRRVRLPGVLLSELCSGRVSGSVAGHICLSPAGHWPLPILGILARAFVMHRRLLLEVLAMRTSTWTGFIFFAGLRSHRLLLRRRITASLFLSLILILILILIVLLSCPCKRREPETAR